MDEIKVDKALISIRNLLDNKGQMLSIYVKQNDLQLKCDFVLYINLTKRVHTIIGNNFFQTNNNPHP